MRNNYNIKTKASKANPHFDDINLERMEVSDDKLSTALIENYITNPQIDNKITMQTKLSLTLEINIIGYRSSHLWHVCRQYAIFVKGLSSEIGLPLAFNTERLYVMVFRYEYCCNIKNSCCVF